MIKIKKSKLEELLNCKIPNIKVLGVDTASRTGWAILEAKDDEVTINYGWVDVQTSNNNFKFDRFIEIFGDLIDREKPEIVVIEDTFMRFNVLVVKLLSRLGMIVYVMSRLIMPLSTIRFIGPGRARSNIGLNGTAKKDAVHLEFREKFEIDIKDVDIVDAIVLSLNGIIPFKEIEKKKRVKKTKQKRLLAKKK